MRELLMDLPFFLVNWYRLSYCSVIAQVINPKDNSKSNKHIEHRIIKFVKNMKKLQSYSLQLCEKRK
jgi:hypothetical protein